MVVVDASALVDGLLIAGAARARLASDNLQAPELIDAELLSVLRKLVQADKLQHGHALQALATANRLGLRRHPSRFLWQRRPHPGEQQPSRVRASPRSAAGELGLTAHRQAMQSTHHWPIPASPGELSRLNE